MSDQPSGANTAETVQKINDAYSNIREQMSKVIVNC